MCKICYSFISLFGSIHLFIFWHLRKCKMEATSKGGEISVWLKTSSVAAHNVSKPDWRYQT